MTPESVPAAESVADNGEVRDDGRVIVSPSLRGWVRLTHQDHASYFVPSYEARSLAIRLLRAADKAELIDGSQEARTDG